METSSTYGHVGGLALYNPSTAPGVRLEIEDICRLVAERLHLLPVFRWRLAQVPFNLDLPYWVEQPDFDIDFHIRESAVPPPGDDAKLAETVARIFARALDRARPLWELYLIHGVEGGRMAVLTKIHHAVVDGVSGSEILSILLDPSPEGREVPPPSEASSGERAPGDVEMLARGLLGLPRQPLRAVRALPTTLPNVTGLPGAGAVPGMPTLTRAFSRARRLLGWEEDPGVLEATTARPPRTCFNGPSPRTAGSRSARSRSTRSRPSRGRSVSPSNDVVVALCASALRTWLLERDELPDDPLVAMVPVSVRTKEQRGTFGNRVSMMVVQIPTDEPDLGCRVARTHDLLRAAKERHSALPADLLTDATRFIPPAVMALAARTTVEVLGRTRPPLNVVISNVPGPREPLFFAGARLDANYPVSVIVDGVGLNITVMSYRDHMDFGIVADREQVDDVWSLLDGARRALDELAALVGVPAEAREAASPAAKTRAPG